MKPKEKHWYESKTIVMNIMVAMTMILGLLPTLFSDLKIDENLSLKMTIMVGVIMNVINIVLRFVSTDKIKN